MKLGIIGLGTLSTAIIQGLHSIEYFNTNTIYVSTNNKDTLHEISKLYNLNPVESNIELTELVDIVLIATKPEDLENLAHEIKPYLKDKPLISLAAKTSIDRLVSLFGERPIVRAMPNLSVKFRQSVTAIAYHNTTLEIEDTITNLFSLLGTIIEIPESQFSGFIGLSSSAIAVVFKLVDAIAKAAIQEGFTYDEALRIVSLTTKSAAHSILNSKENPFELTQKVASKRGTTYEGLKVLDEHSFEAIIERAIHAIIEKDKRG